jgi:hypothetical protein
MIPQTAKKGPGGVTIKPYLFEFFEVPTPMVLDTITMIG